MKKSTGYKSANLVPVHRMAVVQPFVRFLADFGAHVERGFRQAQLPWHSLESVDNYVPSHCFWKFLISMAYSESVLDLGFRVGERFGPNCADPQMISLLQKAPTLYQGLNKAAALCNRTVTHSRMDILQPPNCNYTYFHHRPSCNADNPAIEQIGWFGLMTVLGMIRMYTGPHWQPAEIGLMTDRMPGHYIREHFPNTRLRLSQKSSYIALDNDVISLPPRLNTPAPPACSSLSYESLPDDFVCSLERILLSYIREGDLSIELAAGLCNSSKRTLQRRLKESGTNYHEVLDHVRFRAAIRLLQNPDVSVIDVANCLGYTDGSNFSRAFRRIAGLTPRAYRRQRSQEGGHVDVRTSA